jgi:hypothetical protein
MGAFFHGVGDYMGSDLIAHAEEEKWCVNPWFTTCGNRDFRRALEELSRKEPNNIAQLMAEHSPAHLQTFSNWTGSIEICFLYLTPGTHFHQVLDAWLPQIGENTIRFADNVLYRIIKNVPFARVAANA